MFSLVVTVVTVLFRILDVGDTVAASSGRGLALLGPPPVLRLLAEHLSLLLLLLAVVVVELAIS